MHPTYRKAAPKRQPKRKMKRHPELPLAAEMAGVTYWMAYKVMRGQAQSAKVTKALKAARKQLRVMRKAA